MINTKTFVGSVDFVTFLFSFSKFTPMLFSTKKVKLGFACYFTQFPAYCWVLVTCVYLIVLQLPQSRGRKRLEEVVCTIFDHNCKRAKGGGGKFPVFLWWVCTICHVGTRPLQSSIPSAPKIVGIHYCMGIFQNQIRNFWIKPTKTNCHF